MHQQVSGKNALECEQVERGTDRKATNGKSER